MPKIGQTLGGAAALMALALGACSERGGAARADGDICTPFAAQPAIATTDPAGVAGAAVTGGGEAAAFDDCLHRWGYRLARAEDDAGVAAAATVAACAPALSRWNQAALAQAPGTAANGEAVSLVTGENTDAIVGRYQAAQDKALFYVVQARAGHCDLPPAPKAAG